MNDDPASPKSFTSKPGPHKTASNKPSRKSWFQHLRDIFDADPQNRHEVLDMLRDATDDGVLDRDTLNMLEGVMGVADLRVRDIMIPRAQMNVVDVENNFKTVMAMVIENAHSRYPVIDGSRDKVEGILLAKDLLPYMMPTTAEHGAVHAESAEEFDLYALLRPALAVPESKRCDVLLREFRANRNHMAIVVDEYGSVCGLVTIEDVLEQIVGDISDEYDFEDDDELVRDLGGNEWRVRAETPVADFNLQLGVAFGEEEFDTIAGIVLHHCGHMPVQGETIKIDNLQFTVLSADARRLKLLRVRKLV